MAALLHSPDTALDVDAMNNPRGSWHNGLVNAFKDKPTNAQGEPIFGAYKSGSEAFQGKGVVPVRAIFQGLAKQKEADGETTIAAVLNKLAPALSEAAWVKAPAMKFNVDGKPDNRVLFYKNEEVQYQRLLDTADLEALIDKVGAKHMRLVKQYVHFSADRDYTNFDMRPRRADGKFGWPNAQGFRLEDLLAAPIGPIGASHVGSWSRGVIGGKPVPIISDWGHETKGTIDHSANIFAIDYQAGCRDLIPEAGLKAYKQNADMWDAIATMQVPFAEGTADETRFKNYMYNPLECHDQASTVAVAKEISKLDFPSFNKKFGAFYCSEGVYSVANFGPQADTLIKTSNFSPDKPEKQRHFINPVQSVRDQPGRSIRVMALVPLVAFYMIVDRADAGKLFQDFKTPYIGDALILALPLAAFWLLAVYLPRRMLLELKKDPEKDKLLLAISAISWIVFFAGALVLPFYYAAYNLGGWPKIVEWMPTLGNTTFWYVVPLILYALLTVILPSRLIGWIGNKVEGLRDKLPKKYDPDEDENSPTTYLNYRTPGDEAGMHLRIFGFITWLIQTLTLSASVVLAFGLGLLLLLAVEGILSVSNLSLFGALGISPFTQTDNFIQLMNTLTYYPVVVYNFLFGWIPGAEMVYLGNLENQEAVAQKIPLAMAIAIVLIFVGLMPSILLAIGLSYVIAMWLRGSGLVFGGEKFVWTLANKISANQRASDNANVRTVYVTPEAWWNMEMAHCYFYKSGSVIKDVAVQISNWNDLKPNRDFPLGSVVARIAQWMVVAFFVLGILSASVSMANSLVDGFSKGFVQSTSSDTSSEEKPAEPSDGNP